jgi:hypothetical protein
LGILKNSRVCKCRTGFVRQASTFVLREVHGAKVLETLNQLRRFYGLTPLDLIDLKIAIAKNGGYIPGALVL